MLKKIELAKKKYHETLVQLKQKLNILEHYEEDYCSIVKLLETLPDKTRHDVMVLEMFSLDTKQLQEQIPITNVSFMEGSLFNTNKFIVLLGENYFVERSAKQTIEISNRRLLHIKEKTNSLVLQIKNFDERIKLVNELEVSGLDEEGNEIVEIREYIDEPIKKEVVGNVFEKKEKDANPKEFVLDNKRKISIFKSQHSNNK